MSNSLIVPQNASGSLPAAGYHRIFATGNVLFSLDPNGVKSALTFFPKTYAGTAYTVSKEDIGSVICFTSASAVTVTVPAGLGDNFNAGFIRRGAGSVTFSASGVTIESAGGSLVISDQHAGVSLVAVAKDTLNLGGSLA